MSCLAPRAGVVTGVNGSSVQVRWDDGHETSFVPTAGSMRVLPSKGGNGGSQEGVAETMPIRHPRRAELS